MKIAIDTSPIGKNSGHRVRGSGSYVNLLYKYLPQFDKINSYIFFDRKLDKQVDLIHYPYFDPFFLTLPFLKKTKRIVTVHDLIPIIFPDNFPVGIRGNLKWLIQSFLLKRTDAIITDSESSRKDIIKILNIRPDKVFRIYLCANKSFGIINNESLKKKIKNKYNLPDRFVLYVGDATWNKNLPRLVKAIKSTKVPLVLVGSALVSKKVNLNYWNKDLISFQKETNGNSNFIKLGYVSEEDLVVIYNLATALLMPSLYEGFGLPVVEAMTCGCPIVLSREGSLPEVGGKAAFYVNAKDAENISKGIIEVFKNKDLELELRNLSLEQAKKFSCDITIKETIQVYEKI